MTKFIAINAAPKNNYLVISVLDGPTAFHAREYAAHQFGIEPMGLVVTETGEDAVESVRLRYVGNAAANPSTLRLQCQTLTKRGGWTKWEDRQ